MTSLTRMQSTEDDVEGHALRFPVRAVTERIVRLCEDLEAQHIPTHGSWLSITQIDMMSLSSEWLTDGAPEGETMVRGSRDIEDRLVLA